MKITGMIHSKRDNGRTTFLQIVDTEIQLVL